ncbi:hypothetical protein [Bacillus sp. JCM 19041]|uniref:hypothetical protein n=1 Tax=Bacillus sp. JCM 19041 TaxID=1460637 RepID=UPI0006D16635
MFNRKINGGGYMDIFTDIFFAVSPVIIMASLGIAAIAFTVVKTQDGKMKELERRIEKLERK